MTLIDRTTGAVAIDRTTEYTLYGIDSIKPDGNDYILCASCQSGPDAMTATLLRYSPKDGSMKPLYVPKNVHCTDYIDGELYSVGYNFYTYQLSRITDKGQNEELIRSVDSAELHDAFSTFSGMLEVEFQPQKLFVTGYDMIMWNAIYHTVAIYDMTANANGATLNVMFPTQSTISNVIKRRSLHAGVRKELRLLRFGKDLLLVRICRPSAYEAACRRPSLRYRI